MTTATFSMPIAMFQGQGLALDNLPEPVWLGTLEEYLDDHDSAYTFGQARDMLSVLAYGRQVPVAENRTLVSQRTLAELRFWYKLRTG